MGADSWLVAEALDTLDDVFYVYDERGRLVHWNAVLAELFEYTDEEMAGMAASDFFVPADRPQVEAAVEEVLETGRTVVEARAETTRGTVLFELTGELLTDQDGTPLGFCGVGRDVTKVREREWQLERQNHRLGEFANVVAHDLRNPLQVAKLQLEAASGTPDAETVASVTEALDRIEGIVEDVLTLAREGQTVLDKRTVELATVARAAWDAVKSPESTLVVRTTATVEADESRLQRLFENVFRNAVEHGSTSNRNSPSSGDAVEHGSTSSRPEADDAVEHGSTSNRRSSDTGIERGTTGDASDGTRGVTVTVEDTETGFAVEDDGPGFAEELSGAVFDAGVTDSASGTGLGLNIVRSLAEAHGWMVSAEEGEGGGARLEFDFESFYAETPSLEVRDDERGE